VDFRLDECGVLMFRDRVCVPDVSELKKRDRISDSVPKPIEVVKYRSHKDCF